MITTDFNSGDKKLMNRIMNTMNCEKKQRLPESLPGLMLYHSECVNPSTDIWLPLGFQEDFADITFSILKSLVSEIFSVHSCLLRLVSTVSGFSQHFSTFLRDPVSKGLL